MNKSGLHILMCLFLALFMESCGKQIPGDIIQPAEMENLLYDYHLAITMGNDLSYDERYKRELYRDYVFEKHGVDEALFDSSMVWYTRHAKELAEIYKNLQKRFEMGEEQMRSQLNKRSGQIEVSLSGDSVDVWSDRDLYWLTKSPLTNKLMFDLKADTTFHEEDVMVFSADFNFLSPEKIKTPRIVAALNVIFKNDSTQAVTKVIDKSGYYELCLNPDSAFEYKSVNGFVYFNTSDSLDVSALIRNIKLMRYRKGSYKSGNASLDVSEKSVTEKAGDVEDKSRIKDARGSRESSDNSVKREIQPLELKQITE